MSNLCQTTIRIKHKELPVLLFFQKKKHFQVKAVTATSIILYHYISLVSVDKINGNLVINAINVNSEQFQYSLILPLTLSA